MLLCTLKTAVILNPPQTWCQRAASQMPPGFLRICSTAPQPKSLQPPVTGGVGGKATSPRCRELWGNNGGARSRRMVDDFLENGSTKLLMGNSRSLKTGAIWWKLRSTMTGFRHHLGLFPSFGFRHTEGRLPHTTSYNEEAASGAEVCRSSPWNDLVEQPLKRVIFVEAIVKRIRPLP